VDEDAGLLSSGQHELASRLVAIVESSDDAIIGKTLDGIITSWNRGAERMYGYTAQEMIGCSVSRIFPPDRTGELAPILDRLRRGELIDHFETRRVCKDGTVIDVSVSVSPIRDAAGAVVGAATVTRDVTEHNRVAAERTGMEFRLRQAERLETVGLLAGGIAHDFNNLLGAILGYAALVAGATAGDPDIPADAGKIQSVARRAGRLTRQLLIFSRRALTQPELVDVNAIVGDVQELLSVSIGSGVELRLELAGSIPAILADRGQVEQVLLNLAFNARDAMPEGGILTIGTRLTVLSAGDEALDPDARPGRYVQLTVSDTGTGMSAEVASRILEPFFTTKPEGLGTGLGLSTVHNIVSKAGGSLRVDPGEGTGSRFRIYFPAMGGPALPAPPKGGGPAARGNGEKVLVVDDEPAVREVVSRILRRNGYTALEASGGEQALALVASHEIQLLLTDSVMPGMSGAGLAKLVAGLKPGLPVLYMSGFSAGVLSEERVSSGELAFIQKPFTAEALLAKVHASLGDAALV
jgi:two-component system, cell cycle sensor histidine kinase and response regulator CckA